MIEQKQLLSIISLIKNITKTDEIYVFGSYANGSQKENSDLDIAVIKDDISHENEESFAIRKKLLETDYVPLDLFFLDRKKFSERKDFYGNLYNEVAKKGKKFNV